MRFGRGKACGRYWSRCYLASSAGTSKNFKVKERRVLTTVAKAFDLATKLVNQVFVSAVATVAPSAERVGIADVLEKGPQ